MKEELEKLGFEYNFYGELYTKKIGDIIIKMFLLDRIVYISTGIDCIDLFPYNHEKLKQLIQILS